jgi:hypothetical protein
MCCWLFELLQALLQLLPAGHGKSNGGVVCSDNAVHVNTAYLPGIGC